MVNVMIRIIGEIQPLKNPQSLKVDSLNIVRTKSTKWKEFLRVALQRWIVRVEIYRPRGEHSNNTEFIFGGPVKRKSEEEKCNYLMICIGNKGRDIYNTWELTVEEAKKLDTYYVKYEEYVKPKSNKVFARYKFHQKIQREGESFEQFLTDLKLLVKDCGYTDPDEMVKDRVVIGCHSTKTRETLIQEGSELTLEKLIDIA